jgi:F-type H+-transporting ATPase subunit a
MTLVPHKAQNFFEFIVEFLYGQVEGIVGEKQANWPSRCSARSSSTSWFPTGSVCFQVSAPSAGASPPASSSRKLHDPLLRPPTADLNATIGLAVSAFLVWLFLTIKEVGVWGFIVHTFGPKGGLKGLMGIVVPPCSCLSASSKSSPSSSVR